MDPSAAESQATQVKAQSPYQTTHSHSVDPEQATPMVRQFVEVKRQYPGVVLLYRMGDFYETFFEDAIQAARLLEITLTGRDAGKYGRIPMAGIPVRAIDSYVPRLLQAQVKVAICEQVEDPAQAKGLVERRVVRVLSSGTLTDGQHLKSDENNFLAAIVLGKSGGTTQEQGDLPCGFAYCDVSTGQFMATTLNFDQLTSELSRVNPSEVLVLGKNRPHPDGLGIPELKPVVPPDLEQVYSFTPVESWACQWSDNQKILCDLLGVSHVDGFGLQDHPMAAQAVGMIAHYLKNTFLDEQPPLDGIQVYHLDRTVAMSPTARKNLELLATVRDGREQGSLFGFLNRTQTAMGARLLRQWVSQPLQDLGEIQARLDSVEALTEDHGGRETIAQLLPEVYDLERLASRVSNLSVSPKDCLALSQSLSKLPAIAEVMAEHSAFYLVRVQGYPPELAQCLALIQEAITDDPPLQITEGGVIRPGYYPELDTIRDTVAHHDQWIQDYEAQQREATGIRSLKVSFNNAFGYYIEVSKSNLSMVPEAYHRKQTLTNAERYTTPELKAQEERLVEAQGKLYDLEYQLYVEFRQKLSAHSALLKDVAQRVAALDVIQSLATVAVEKHYCRPQVDQSLALDLQGLRHPVVEAMLPMGQFVPNPCRLVGRPTAQPASGNEAHETQIMIITGPNMAGKSTYMRQVALAVIMAQMGAFVPAESAHIGMVDSIFTRIGAVDDLSGGQSTFMVEMSETAQILNNATPRSLVVLDEVGRGTSTYDGVAIAWSVAEYMAQHNGCRTLFATHYHELNALESVLPQSVANYRVCVSETEGHIEFLHRVEPGAAQKSYGIQVAKMAGVPSRVIQQAAQRLSALQKKSVAMTETRRKILKTSGEVPQLNLFEAPGTEVECQAELTPSVTPSGV